MPKKQSQAARPTGMDVSLVMVLELSILRKVEEKALLFLPLGKKRMPWINRPNVSPVMKNRSNQHFGI
jgi:hypothetical protein